MFKFSCLVHSLKCNDGHSGSNNGYNESISKVVTCSAPNDKFCYYAYRIVGRDINIGQRCEDFLSTPDNLAIEMCIYITNKDEARTNKDVVYEFYQCYCKTDNCNNICVPEDCKPFLIPGELKQIDYTNPYINISGLDPEKLKNWPHDGLCRAKCNSNGNGGNVTIEPVKPDNGEKKTSNGQGGDVTTVAGNPDDGGKKTNGSLGKMDYYENLLLSLVAVAFRQFHDPLFS